MALNIQHVLHMDNTFICGLSRSKIMFPHYLKIGTIFEKVIELTVGVLIFSTTFIWDVCHSKHK